MLLLTVVAFAFVSSVAFAEEPAGIPDNIVTELSSLVGTWEVERKIGDVTQTGHFTCRWEKDEEGKKCCIIGRFRYDTNGEIRSGVTLIGWNAVKKCIEDRGLMETEETPGCCGLSNRQLSGGVTCPSWLTAKRSSRRLS